MQKKRKLFSAFISRIFGFCPQCNSDAPNIDSCEVCENDRTSPFKFSKRKHYWNKYREYVDCYGDKIAFLKYKGYSDDEIKLMEQKAQETFDRCKEFMENLK